MRFQGTMLPAVTHLHAELDASYYKLMHTLFREDQIKLSSSQVRGA